MPSSTRALELIVNDKRPIPAGVPYFADTATTRFAMDGPPQLQDFQLGFSMTTSGLCGCSVVLLASPTMIFGVHVSRGEVKVQADGTIQPHDLYVRTPELMASLAARRLLQLYKQHRGRAGNEIKAMIITALQPPELGADPVALTLWDELKRIPSRVWHTYNAQSICAIPDDAERDRAGTLIASRTGNSSSWPGVYLGGTCFGWVS